MPNLLYVEASPRKKRSASIEVAKAYIDQVQKNDPSTEVRTLDVWNLNLPEFTDEMMEAKYAGLSGSERSLEQEKAWGKIESLAQSFHWADIIVFAIPLWNFGIPYKLKHLIDVVTQKDILFTFTNEEGLKGKLENKRAMIVYARGFNFDKDSHTPARDYDFQGPYMEMWLRLIGVDKWDTVLVEKTIFGPEIDQQSRSNAREEAIAIANRL